MDILLPTSRLLIRPLVPGDLDHFHCYRSNPEICRYQGFDVMDRESAANFIRENAGKRFGKPGEWVQCAIALRENDRLIGDCALRLDSGEPRIAEIGITISHLEQQKGYARESMNALLAFLFEEQNIHRVAETVDAENTASIQLLKSVGFRQEGHFIENIFFKGKWGSELLFALLQKEWKAK